MNQTHSMSPRARGYLTVATVHFGLIGISIVGWPQLYGSSAFVPIIEFTHLYVWGVAYLLTSSLCLAAAITRWPSFARAGLICAFIVLFVSSFAVGWGVVASWTDGNPATVASPVVPLSFGALAVKDLLMIGRPLRTPVEDYLLAQAELAR
jgi:drug/metabolite transporter (DMT)-like permease